MFKFITHDNTDAYFNLASEEYLLKQTDGYYIYLWRNDNAVIVGVNQNAIEEVNLDFTEKHGIKVVRRLTGGGAVYHDLNNICYTVIAPFSEGEDSYRKFTAPVINYLNSLGVKAEFSGRNDIVLDGKKISGNAQTVYKNKIMHHGTILFDSNMEVLEGALKPNKLKMQSKGIKSVRARVTNIKSYLNSDMTAEKLKQGLSEYFLRTCKPYSFTEKDIEAIEKLREEKYSTFSWNIGNSPKCSNRSEERFSFGTFCLEFDVLEGKIQNAHIFGDFFCLKPIEEFTEKLNGVNFIKSEILKVFANVNLYIVNADGKEIVERLFK